jgi:phosphoglycolate phosphatase
MGAPDMLLLDLDGTISDPAEGIGRSLDHALASYGYATLEPGTVSTHIGPPLDDTFRQLTGATCADRIAGLVARYRERYAERGYAENTLYPGIPEALAGLADSGIPLGLCTSKRVDFAEQVLSHFALREHFVVVSGGDIGIPKAEQLRRLVDAGRVGSGSVMVGDRAVDVHAGRANGLRAVGVLWGHGSVEELRAAGPDRLLAHPDELAGLAALVR